MKLRAIRLRHVRRFASNGCALENIEDGINVFAEPNEVGKSTLFDALSAALFYKHSAQSKHVAQLVPYDGNGAPLIEIDVEHCGHLFRIRKQFWSKPFATVTDLSSGEETARADATHDWIRSMIGADKPEQGPSGLLWITQGQSLEQPRGGEGRDGFLTDLLSDQLTSITGGSRARTVISRAESELGKLVTDTQRPKAGGPYKLALDRATKLEEIVDELTEKVLSAESELSGLTHVRKELTRLHDPAARRQRSDALNTANQNLETAKSAAARIEALNSNVAVSEANLTAARNDHDNFAAKSDEAAGLAEELAELKECRATVSHAQKVAEEVVRASKARWEELFDEHTKARQRMETVSAQRKVREARALLQQRRETLEQVKAAQSALADAQGAVDEIAVTQVALGALEDLEQERIRADAHVTAGQTVLEVCYDKGTTSRITQNGIAVLDGESVAISEATEFVVQDVATLSVRPGAGGDVSKAQADLIGINQSISKLLADVKVASLLEARAQLQRRNAAMSIVQQQAEVIARLAPDGVDALQSEVQKLTSSAEADGDEPLDEEDEEELRAKEASASEAFLSARNQHDVAVKEESILFGELQALTAKTETTEGRLKALHAEVGVPDGWEQALIKKSDEVAETQRQLNDLKKRLDEIAGSVPNLDQAQVAVKRLEEAKANVDDRINQLSISETTHATSLRHLQAEGVGELLERESDKLAAAKKAVKAHEFHIDSLNLLLTRLTETQDAVREQYFAPLRDELTPLLNTLHPGSRISFADDFSPARLQRGAMTEELERLSGGTQEQIAILTRLAFARLMAKNDQMMPVILDDALVYSDDDRIELMFDALNMAAADLQVLVLTCRQRAFENLGGTRLSLKDWPES